MDAGLVVRDDVERTARRMTVSTWPPASCSIATTLV